MPTARHQSSDGLEEPVHLVCDLLSHQMLYLMLNSRDQLIRTFIMDGNFSAEHMRHRSGERDVSLSAGMAFMANPDSYKAHLWSGTELPQVHMPYLPR